MQQFKALQTQPEKLKSFKKVSLLTFIMRFLYLYSWSLIIDFLLLIFHRLISEQKWFFMNRQAEVLRTPNDVIIETWPP